MKNFITPGGALDLVAPSGGVVAGRGVKIGGIFGVAATTAAEGETFSCAVRGVFEFAAATHASTQGMAVGDTAYWDDTAKVITKTSSGNTAVGLITETKVTTVALARVLIPAL
jgi:predicted RecA/RadA family phage recombinase